MRSGSNENAFARGLPGRRGACPWVRARRDPRGRTPAAGVCHARTLRARGGTGMLPPPPRAPHEAGLLPSRGRGRGAGGGATRAPGTPSQRPAGKDPSRGVMLGGAARRGGPTLSSLSPSDPGILVICTYRGCQDWKAALAAGRGWLLEPFGGQPTPLCRLPEPGRCAGGDGGARGILGVILPRLGWLFFFF